jgi:hypothetical protein
VSIWNFEAEWLALSVVEGLALSTSAVLSVNSVEELSAIALMFTFSR